MTKDKIGCEDCEFTGRINCHPDDTYHTHPCDTCQPEANKEFQLGASWALGEAK